MNNFTGVGRLTEVIDLKYTQSGDTVGNFTLAINRNFTNQQGEREADFIRCVVWRKTAENLAKFTKKGSQIGIEGRIQTRNYENQQGQRVYVTEIVVEQFHLLEPRQDNQNQQHRGYSQNYVQSQGHSQSNQGNYSQGQNHGRFKMQDGHPVDVSPDDLPF
ncbi:single-stranded DNA-binding protein [Aerococcaceae bacterium WGS1372]